MAGTKTKTPRLQAVQVRLEPDLYRELEELAKSEQRSMAAQLVRIIGDYFRKASA